MVENETVVIARYLARRDGITRAAAAGRILRMAADERAALVAESIAFTTISNEAPSAVAAS